MTITISTGTIVYVVVLIMLIALTLYRVKKMFQVLGDIEDYLLDNNIWLNVFIPNIIILTALFAMILYPFFK